MREKVPKQMLLMPSITDHPQAMELEAISHILDDNPTIYDHVMQDPVNFAAGTPAKGQKA
jgi:hypothetical protein